MSEYMDYYVTVLFLLLFSHAVFDFGIQQTYVATNKDRNTDPHHWGWVLSAHALMHGGGVYLATGSNVWLGIAETTAHFLIDFWKCDKKLNYHQDQILHILCKIVWLIVVIVQCE